MFDGPQPSPVPILVPPFELAQWIGAARPHLARMASASGGRYDTADIIAALAAGRMLLWMAVEGDVPLCVMVSEFQQYPRSRALRLIGISGSRPGRWTHLLAWVERVARERLGCSHIEAMHQRGHGRLLRTGGWRESHVLSEKAL